MLSVLWRLSDWKEDLHRRRQGCCYLQPEIATGRGCFALPFLLRQENFSVRFYFLFHWRWHFFPLQVKTKTSCILLSIPLTTFFQIIGCYDIFWFYLSFFKQFLRAFAGQDLSTVKRGLNFLNFSIVLFLKT